MDFEPLAVMGVGLLLGSVIRVRRMSCIVRLLSSSRTSALVRYPDHELSSFPLLTGRDRVREQHRIAVRLGIEPCCRS